MPLPDEKRDQQFKKNDFLAARGYDRQDKESTYQGKKDSLGYFKGDPGGVSKK